MSVKSIGWYSELIAEFAPEIAHSYPNMKDSFSRVPVPHKDVIVSYLHSGDIGSIPVGCMRDVFTGEQTSVRDADRSDGEYEWSEGLAYYVENYNLQLPQDFVDHILKSSGVPA